jgi:predicted histone-like DNA-binding protein
MKYKLVKENKPTLSTFGKYKAVTVHNEEVTTKQILEKVARRDGISEGDVITVMMGLSHVIKEHLRRGDKVRLDTWGLMKLEIESDKVDSPDDFRPRKNIRGVRLHFLPESDQGKPELYQDLKFEREK